MNSFTCGACSTINTNRAACCVCGTASATATPESLATTALADAAAARAAQLEEAAKGNHELAEHLGHVTDAHLDDALALRCLGTT
jgi:riboflavin synthase alpha subunit